MCLAAWALGQSEQFPWLLASNRDESFERPASPMAWWRPTPLGPELLSGRDLSAGGTWMGLTRAGRLALVTNVREPGRQLTQSPSRGALVVDWLQREQVLGEVQPVLQEPRNGFNLVSLDLGLAPLNGKAAYGQWFSNRAPGPRLLVPGVYALSNAALDDPWPKVQSLKRSLGQAVASSMQRQELVDSLLLALANPHQAADDVLPRTGVPLERERLLSPAFIRIASSDLPPRVYGTRCSTVVVVERTALGHQLHVVERSFDATGRTSAQLAFQWPLQRLRAPALSAAP